MFDCGVAHYIEGTDIDRPRNAITLSQELHGHFGEFKICFEPVPDREGHTYRFHSFYLPFVTRQLDLPNERTLFLAKDRNIDPPLPRFLALHRAIAWILHLSGAGEYIDQILQDMERKDIRADGSTDIGRLVSLQFRLGESCEPVCF